MTTEDKLLLVQDLCARLPYGVKVEDTRCGVIGRLRDMTVIPLYKGDDAYDYLATTNFYHDCYYDNIDLFKPYLFPMSSMTDKQKKEFELSFDLNYASAYFQELQIAFNMIKWLNKNHFDYNGLIKKGLAIDATGKNIY